MKENRIKIYGLIVGVIMFICLIAGFTYAYYEASVSTEEISGTVCLIVDEDDYGKSNNVSMTNGEFKLLDESAIINQTNNTITVTSGMAMAYVTAGINSSCNIEGYIDINMNVTTLDKTFTSGGDCAGALKYVIASFNPTTYTAPTIANTNGTSFTIIGSGSITSTGNQQIYEGQLPNNGSQNGYMILFYVDGNLANTHNTEGDQWSANFAGTISAVANQGNLND